MRRVAAIGEKQFVLGTVKENCHQPVVIEVQLRIDREFVGDEIPNSNVMNAFFALVIARDQENALPAIHKATMTFPAALGP